MSIGILGFIASKNLRLQINIFNKYSYREYLLGSRPSPSDQQALSIRKFSTSSSKLSDLDRIFESIKNKNAAFLEYQKELDNRKKEEAKAQELAAQKEELQRQLEQIQEQGKQEKTFLEQSQEKLDGLIHKQKVVEGKLEDHLMGGYRKLNDLGKVKEILESFKGPFEDLKKKLKGKVSALEEEFKDGKSVEYFQKRVDIEAANFKKCTHLLEDKEKLVHEEIKKSSFYDDAVKKLEYEKERSE